MDSTDSYLKDELREAFKVIDTCLACIYSGESHMYRAMASQLRILLCDTRYKKGSSLLMAVYPKLKVSGLESINWSSEKSGHVSIDQTESGTNRVGQMPFEITHFQMGYRSLIYNLQNQFLFLLGSGVSKL